LALTFFTGVTSGAFADGWMSSASNEHVTTISASLPQFSHLQTFLIFFSAIQLSPGY
jgi:hypothetical protein